MAFQKLSLADTYNRSADTLVSLKSSRSPNDVFSTNRRTVAYLVIGREVNCFEPFRVRCSTGINLAKAIAGSAVLK
jgi:hypothetical protein